MLPTYYWRVCIRYLMIPWSMRRHGWWCVLTILRLRPKYSMTFSRAMCSLHECRKHVALMVLPMNRWMKLQTWYKFMEWCRLEGGNEKQLPRDMYVLCEIALVPVIHPMSRDIGCALFVKRVSHRIPHFQCANGLMDLMPPHICLARCLDNPEPVSVLAHQWQSKYQVFSLGYLQNSHMPVIVCSSS